jgi:hypothetical protein
MKCPESSPVRYERLQAGGPDVMVELRAVKPVPRQGRPQNSQDKVRRGGQPGIVSCHFGRELVCPDNSCHQPAARGSSHPGDLVKDPGWKDRPLGPGWGIFGDALSCSRRPASGLVVLSDEVRRQLHGHGYRDVNRADQPLGGPSFRWRPSSFPARSAATVLQQYQQGGREVVPRQDPDLRPRQEWISQKIGFVSSHAWRPTGHPAYYLMSSDQHRWRGISRASSSVSSCPWPSRTMVAAEAHVRRTHGPEHASLHERRRFLSQGETVFHYAAREERRAAVSEMRPRIGIRTTRGTIAVLTPRRARPPADDPSRRGSSPRLAHRGGLHRVRAWRPQVGLPGRRAAEDGRPGTAYLAVEHCPLPARRSAETNGAGKVAFTTPPAPVPLVRSSSRRYRAFSLLPVSFFQTSTRSWRGTRAMRRAIASSFAFRSAVSQSRREAVIEALREFLGWTG